MSTSYIYLRFYEELNDYLPEDRRKKTLSLSSNQVQTVKDAIEYFDVPTGEVDLILANHQSVSLDYKPEPGDQISVYPVFESLEMSGIQKVRNRPLRTPRFLVDRKLKELGQELYIRGFDVKIDRGYPPDKLPERAEREERILLTYREELITRERVSRGYVVHSTEPTVQLEEIKERFNLK